MKNIKCSIPGSGKQKNQKKKPMNLVNATTPASTQVGEHVLVVSEQKLPYHLK